MKFTAQKLSIEFLTLDDSEAYPLFKAAYEEVCHLVRQGHPLPAMPDRVMLPKTPNKELARRHIQQIKQHLGA